MKISKYFWDLNEKALSQTEKILKNPEHPQFIGRLITLLSRCDEPKDLFSVIPKQMFVEVWPKVRAHWAKVARISEFRAWWETVYEQLLEKVKVAGRGPKGAAPDLFLRIGRMIQEARIKTGMSQADLAHKVGMRQPDISMIEKGKKNITIETLAFLSKALNIEILKLK